MTKKNSAKFLSNLWCHKKPRKKVSGLKNIRLIFPEKSANWCQNWPQNGQNGQKSPFFHYNWPIWRGQKKIQKKERKIGFCQIYGIKNLETKVSGLKKIRLIFPEKSANWCQNWPQNGQNGQKSPFFHYNWPICRGLKNLTKKIFR